MSDTVCNNTSVGVLVQRRSDERYLLFTRQKPPWGKAPSAGHVDELRHLNQDDEEAVYCAAASRELYEETGLVAGDLELVLGPTITYIPCRRPQGSWHRWRVYHTWVDGDQEVVENQDESKDLEWFSIDEIAALAARTRSYRAGLVTEEEFQADPGLEPVWYDFFLELGLIGL